MPDSERCHRCHRKTAAISIVYFRGKAYGKGCLEYCKERADTRSLAAATAKCCSVCGVRFLYNEEHCSSSLCCHCCLRGPRYCDL